MCVSMSAILWFFIITLFSNEREEKERCGFGWVGRIWEGPEEGNPDQTTLKGVDGGCIFKRYLPR